MATFQIYKLCDSNLKIHDPTNQLKSYGIGMNEK